jgi:xylan 1,4-beta-xylosidase
MKARWIIPFSGIVCLTACDSPKKSLDDATTAIAEPVPFHLLIEAEIHGTAGEKIEDIHASSSFYVKRQSGDFQTVIVCKVPPSGNALKVWIRRKGGPVQMVLSNNGEQKESPWIRDVEDQFVWASCGEIDLGGEDRELIFIGNDDNTQSVSIDCILFTEGEIADKDALLTPLPSITIDPAAVEGAFRSAPKMWGVNLAQAGNPAGLAKIDAHLVRINCNGLLDTQSRAWDEASIRGLVVMLLGDGNTGEKVLNIPGWPHWMDADRDGFLDADQIDDYADLAGRFAEIVWENPAARECVVFELLNEQDIPYHETLVWTKQPHRVAELARIYLSAASRIHEAAPGAKVGGSSAMDASNMDFHEQFIAITAPELDFYSVHFNLSRAKEESDSSMLAKADSVTSQLVLIREILNKNSSDRQIPISLTEYGFNRDAEDAFGAVWDAAFAMNAFAAGADSAAWKGNVSPDDGHSPYSYLFHVLNTNFSAPAAILKTDHGKLLTGLITEDGNHILLTHRSLRDRKIILPEGKWKGWILANNFGMAHEISVEGETDLPGVSVIYLEK